MVSDVDRVELFRSVYDESYPRITRFAIRRARSREDAFDAVSETFVVVWRRLDDLPAEGGRLAWVYGIARRVLANQYRTHDRTTNLISRLGRHSQINGDAQFSDERTSFDLVHEALGRLRDADRELLTMVAWDDLDHAEIAAILGTSPSNVAVRLHRAKRRLARELDKAGMRGAVNTESVKSSESSRTLNGVSGTIPAPENEETP